MHKLSLDKRVNTRYIKSIKSASSNNNNNKLHPMTKQKSSEKNIGKTNPLIMKRVIKHPNKQQSQCDSNTFSVWDLAESPRRCMLIVQPWSLGQSSPPVPGQSSPPVPGQSSPPVPGQSSPPVPGQSSPPVTASAVW